jgi:hypothetical protein
MVSVNPICLGKECQAAVIRFHNKLVHGESVYDELVRGGLVHGEPVRCASISTNSTLDFTLDLTLDLTLACMSFASF